MSSLDEPNADLFFAYNYILLEDHVKPEVILDIFNQFASKYADEYMLPTLIPHLIKVSDIHLNSRKDRELEKNGSLLQVKVIAGLALFVLLITLFNYFNLRYINLIQDLKSLKILSYSGAKSKGVFAYVLLESFLYSLCAAIVSFGLLLLLLPAFNQFIGTQLRIQTSAFLLTALIALAGLILTSMLIGILPVTFHNISRTINRISDPNQVTGTLAASGIQSGILKSLVGIQYIATFVLIIGVIVIQGQVKLFMENSLGNDQEKLLCVKKLPVQIINKYQVFKEELLKNPLIYDVTSCMEDPGTEILDMMAFECPNLTADADSKMLNVSPVDDNFFDFYDIPLVAGQNFPTYKGNDSIPESFILNEKAIEFLGWKPEEAIGQPFRLKNQYTSKEFGRIVGVVKNFQPSTMKEEVQPYVYFQKSFWLFSGQIRYDTSRTAESLAHIKNTWIRIYPDFPFNYDFVDNLYQDIYQKEFQLKKMSLLLCTLAIIIAAMGLFAITGITYRTRTKEIGIRKVNGARLGGLIRWLVRDIVLIVAGAILVAIPLSYYLANLWLSSYINAYKLSTCIYVLASIVLVCIALATVGWQTWRAASQNPVDALRYE